MMPRSSPPSLPARVVLVLAVIAPAACNVFASIERCQSNADCPIGAICDPEGRYCVATAADGGTDGSDERDGPAEDAGDATLPACDLEAPFATVGLVAGLADRGVYSARFTSNEQTVLLALLNGGEGSTNVDLFSAHRPDRSAPFVIAGPIPGVNTASSTEYWPTLSADGHLLFFESSRSLQKFDGGYVNDHGRIWSATRPSLIADFDEPRIQSTFVLDASAQDEGAPYLHPLGRALYFISLARGGKGETDIFVADLDEIGLVRSIANVDAVNTATGEHAPVVTLDDRALYFAREEGPERIRNIYVSTRGGPREPFGPSRLVTELATAYEEYPSWVSDDRCRLYFVSNRPSDALSDGAAFSDYRLFVAERRPR